MKNSNFNAKVLVNGEARLSIDFDFGGNYSPETKKEIVGTINAKFLKFMELNKRYKSGIISSKDKIDFQFTHNGKIYSTTEIGVQTNVHFRFNKTIEQKIELFLSDAFDFGQIDEITEAKHIA
jgi:hypothetical protein